MFWGSKIFKSRFLKNFKKLRSKNSLFYNSLPNIWSQIHPKWWAKAGTWFFYAPTFQTIFQKCWHEKNSDFQNFSSCELALVFAILDHMRLKFHPFQPMELETILSKWSKSLYLGLKLKSASWGPVSYPRAKLYMFSNTPK